MKGLFTLLKGIFFSEAKPEKKEKRRKPTFWKLSVKKSLPSITAHWTSSEPEEEENTVNDGYEVGHSQLSTSLQLDVVEKLERNSAIKTENAIVDPRSADQIFRRKQSEELAAVQIQTAFRGYLAKKALHALKGIVKLQAYIRGRAVRRQAMTTLKCLQSVVNIQSQVCAKRTQTPGGAHRHHFEENNEFQTFKDTIIKLDTNGQKRWDESLLTKEEADGMVMSKKEAAMRREKIREYAITHRKSAESYQKRNNTRWKYWLDQWVDTQLAKSKELEDLDFTSNPKPKYEICKNRQLKTPRKLVNHRRQVPVGEDDQRPAFKSPTVSIPAYMVATESAKAKAKEKTRSLSSPRVRPGSFETQSESYSPYKNKLCLTSSVMSEAPSGVRLNNNGSGSSIRPSAYQQRSPGSRGFNARPVKSSHMSLNDLSINSERSLPSWNRQSSFR